MLIDLMVRYTGNNRIFIAKCVLCFSKCEEKRKAGNRRKKIVLKPNILGWGKLGCFSLEYKTFIIFHYVLVLKSFEKLVHLNLGSFS